MSNKQKTTGEKLTELRASLASNNLAGYLVPKQDEWQGEYLPARAERLAWLTAFTGSAGMAIILPEKAAVYSDSRYTVQMDKQVDASLFERQTTDPDTNNTSTQWIKDNIVAGGRLGYDPRLHSPAQIEAIQSKLDENNISLVGVDQNLIDANWADQPDHPDDKVVVHEEKYAGKSSVDKRQEIASELKEGGRQAALITEPDSIAWLLNIRGTDVPNTPFALSYALIHDDGKVDWFIPGSKLTPEVKQHVGNEISFHEFDDMENVLTQQCAGKKILFDDNSASVWFQTILNDAGSTLETAQDPIIAKKAIKNDVEKAGIIEAHIQDGVALVKFWKWVDEQAPTGSLTELDAVHKLRDLRSQRPEFCDTSFDAIVGWAGNGADVHYSVSPESNQTITSDNLLLVDSGGQYKSGTTDNTRTRAIGTPSTEMRDSFTRVLKGHIAIASAQFGDGTTGRDIDVRARQFLNKAGLDYGHGTGHGVGAYLSVHEAGAGISKGFDKPLLPGMLISNEPGFYKVDDQGAGEFGIRIENLVMVEETDDPKLKYKFNTVSLTPIDQKLIDVDNLDRDEIAWLNEYHQKVYDDLSPHLDADEKAWLQKETAPISRTPAP